MTTFFLLDYIWNITIVLLVIMSVLAVGILLNNHLKEKFHPTLIGLNYKDEKTKVKDDFEKGFDGD